MKYAKGVTDMLKEVVQQQIKDNRFSYVRDCFTQLADMYESDEDAVNEIAACLALAASRALYYDDEIDEDDYKELLQKLLKNEDIYEEDDFFEEEDSIPTTLAENLLMEHPRDELEDIARYFEIDTEQPDEMLAMYVADAMMEPDTLGSIFCVMHDPLAAAMNELMTNGSIDVDDTLIERLAGAEIPKDLFHFGMDDRLYVTEDLQEAYSRMNTPEFNDFRRHKVWLGDVVTAFALFYGTAPVDVFTELYNTHPEFRFTDQDTLDFIQMTAKKNRVIDLVDGRLVSHMLLKKKEYRRLERAQGNRPYDMPEPSEMQTLCEFGYPADQPAYREMKSWLQARESHIAIMDAIVLMKVFQIFNASGSIMEAVEDMLEMQPGFSEEEWREYLLLLQKTASATRRTALRGAFMAYRLNEEEMDSILEMIEDYDEHDPDFDDFDDELPF